MLRSSGELQVPLYLLAIDISSILIITVGQMMNETKSISSTVTEEQHYYGSLIAKGIVFGILHVLTGPDHLGALVTLSANVETFKAFIVGVGWGIGHSFGLLLVGTILLLAFANTTTGKVR